MSDRQSAGFVLIAVGVALGVWYFRLSRDQRTALRRGLLGK